MAILGLHFSCGPGDSIRFVHALRCKLGSEKPEVLIITIRKGVERCRGLLGASFGNVWDSPPTLEQTGEIWVAHDAFAQWIAPEGDEPDKWTAEGVASWLDRAGVDPARVENPAVHVYFPRIPRIGKPGRHWSFTSMSGRVIEAVRFDTHDLMGRERIRGPGCKCVVDRVPTIACILRCESVRPSKNSVPEHVRLFCDEARTSGVQLVFCGLRREEDFSSWPIDRNLARVLPYGDLSYVEQIGQLADFDGAVGVNSGGLDLAAAAGIPILRIGEFQKRGYAGEESRCQWGERYNEFLARALNVGLEPWVESLAAFPIEVIRKSFCNFAKAIKANAEYLYTPRHRILDHKVPFDESVLRA